MPRVPAHLRERALGMLQGGIRLKQRYMETGWTERYIRTSHLRDRYRMATTTARVTPGMHNPSIRAQTVRNRLREAGLRACRPVVTQVLTRHHLQQLRLWAQTHHRWTRQDWQKPVLWSGIDLEVEGLSWSGAMCHSIIGLSLLSLPANSTLCVTGKTSSSLMWYPACRLILT
uniref:Transposase Tc1-like domain-containing protein n=1 Tax=Oncorhynchus mykiss TaxID=8022 RepID=A0A8K9X7C3_ONCMY